MYANTKTYNETRWETDSHKKRTKQFTNNKHNTCALQLHAIYMNTDKSCNKQAIFMNYYECPQGNFLLLFEYLKTKILLVVQFPQSLKFLLSHHETHLLRNLSWFQWIYIDFCVENFQKFGKFSFYFNFWKLVSQRVFNFWWKVYPFLIRTLRELSIALCFSTKK